MRAKVIEPCVYDNVFHNVDDMVEGTQEELQSHIDFGYVEAVGEAQELKTEAQEPESEAADSEPANAKPKPSKSRSKK